MQQVSIAYCQFGVTALCKLSGHYVNCWTFCKLSGWYDGIMQIAGHYANCLVGMMALCKLPTKDTFCKMPKQFANSCKNQHYAKCPISHIAHNIHTIGFNYGYACLYSQYSL